MREGKHTQGQRHVVVEAEGERCSCSPANMEDRRQAPGSQEKSRRLPLQVSEKTRPRPHLDFRVLTSRIGEGFISVILGHLVCGDLSQQPKDTDEVP